MSKLVLLAALLASAGRRSLASEGNDAEAQLLSPLHPNCTQSLTDLLLLRQETQLNRMAAAQEATRELLKESLETLVQVRDSLQALGSKAEERPPKSVVCTSPFSQVGDSCLLLALNENHTWTSARQFCAGYGADLAHFSDANTYAAFLEYINTINQERKSVNVWIGGTDEAVEDTWLWVTGELMPRRAPFWGSKDGYRPAPGDGRSQNCAILWQPDMYYIHDAPCSLQGSPLCQM